MIADDDQTQDPTLHRLEQEIAACGFTVPLEALERARTRAESLFATRGTDGRDTTAALGFARDVVGALVGELDPEAPELGRLIERIEAVTAIPRITLGCEVLGMPQLLQLPSAGALELALALLLAFSEARAVSLWTLWPGGDLRKLAHAGQFEREARQTRRLARRLVSGVPAGPRTSRELLSVTVPRQGQPAAALIANVTNPQVPAHMLLLEAAAPMLSAMLEREHLIGLYNGSEQALVTAAERRLARLRFDLHDGPQQDVIMLAADLRQFRARLESVLEGHEATDRIVGSIDDLQARLVALDGDLRRISAYVRSPFMQPESLPDALAQLTDAFASRSEIQPLTHLDGDLTGLSDSQQITVLGVVREALNNIREHSNAENVTISVVTGAHGIEATVTDDGCGFDPETSLVQAARDGHLGLVGMHERVRMLGGRTTIDSRPGGPTVIAVSLPRWTGHDPGTPRLPG